jgi:hypothetical protein
MNENETVLHQTHQLVSRGSNGVQNNIQYHNNSQQHILLQAGAVFIDGNKIFDMIEQHCMIHQA